MPEAAGPLTPKGARAPSYAEAASFALPWLAGIFYADPTPRFADDVAILRTLGPLPLGFEGLISAGLGGLFDHLPLGSRPMRLAWAAALGLGALGWLIYRLALAWQAAARKIDAAAHTPRKLEVGLALSAALSAALGPMFVVEGATPGGYSVAAALSLSVVLIAVGVFRAGGRAPLVLGVLFAAIVIESRSLALATAIALGIAAVTQRKLPEPRAAWGFAASAAAVLILPATLMLALWAFPSPGTALAFFWTSGSTELAPVDRSVALGAWLSGVGLVWCALSLCGLGFGIFNPRTRLLVLPLCAFIALDAMSALASVEPTRRDPQGAVRLLALITFAAAGSLAAAAGVDALRRAKIPFSNAASVLIVVYSFTLVFVGAEDSARAAETRAHSAAGVWTDEALESLPASSVLLVRSEALVLRLLASRASRGSRPDLLIVPMALLQKGGAPARDLARERGLLPLVRDVLLAGRPGEFALAALADARPLFVEPDAGWDKRLYSHLVPLPFFTEFAPHPLGRSDRVLALKKAALASEKVTLIVQKSPDGDPATRAVLARELAQRALVLAALGDREEARGVIDQLLALEAEDPIGLRLKTQLAAPGRGPLNVRELFAAR